MHITFTVPAVNQLEPLMNHHDAVLKLVYDSEGCGCAVNGVPTLWLVSKPDAKDLKADTSSYPVVYNPKHEIFFDDSLTIDFRPETKSYILKSNNQIYNSGMSVIDKR
jgi:uncharacterized protein YqkB